MIPKKINKNVVLVSIILLLGFVFVLIINSNPSDSPKDILIRDGASNSSISSILKKKGLIRSEIFFKVICRITGLSKKLQSGYYTINGGTMGIIIMLSRGDIYTDSITIPEGFTSYQIAELLEKKGIVTTRDFLKSVRNLNIIREYEINFSSLEGFLFPDTYFFKKGISADEIVRAMAKKFFRNIDKKYIKRAKEIGYSLEKMIIFASIVEGEAKEDFERPLISQVYQKRYKIGMKLDADPTVQYAFKSRKKRLFFKDLKINSPYNTYIRKGLPPGPVSNPGVKSILSVLYPAKTGYIYFLSKKDGTHHFSNNYREHMIAYNKYIRNGAEN